MAAPELLVWPPGLPPAERRFNVLRRQRYCTTLGKCAHTDIRCCCNIPPVGCGCANWPEDNCAPPSLPNLTFELLAPTCPAMAFSCTMTRCRAGYSAPAGQGYWAVDFNADSCTTGCLINGSAVLYCERNTAYPNPGCFDYKLDFGSTVSGCITQPSAPQWPTSCDCGSYPSTEAFWRWDDIYELATVGAPCDQICGCPGATLPIPIDIYIHGFPPAPSLFSSAPLTSSVPHTGTPVDDNLPEDVSNWLNGNN